jgi:hypothetical protein
VGWTRFLCGLAFALGLSLPAGCGGDDDSSDVSTSTLAKYLIPPAQLVPQAKLHTDGEFRWTDPIDFVFGGIHIPESVPNEASKAVHEFDDAGFEAGAGEILTTQRGDPQVVVDVVKFDSPGGAAKARDFVQQLYLVQPCHGVCSVNPQAAPTYGVPDAKSVHQVPRKDVKLPPTVFPFEARIIAFPIGSYLYLADAGGPPGSVSQAQWKQGVKHLYDFAKGKTPTS